MSENQKQERIEPLLERTLSEEEFNPEATIQMAEEEVVEATKGIGSRVSSSSVPRVLRSGDLGLVQGRDRYERLDTIGEGATSYVIEAIDHTLNRKVAIKEYKPSGKRSKTDYIGATTNQTSFMHEARITAQLEHPNIIPVHDMDLSEKGDVYFTMKRVVGQSLSDVIELAKQGGILPPEMSTLNHCHPVT